MRNPVIAPVQVRAGGTNGQHDPQPEKGPEDQPQPEKDPPHDPQPEKDPQDDPQPEKDPPPHDPQPDKDPQRAGGGPRVAVSSAQHFTHCRGRDVPCLRSDRRHGS